MLYMWITVIFFGIAFTRQEICLHKILAEDYLTGGVALAITKLHFYKLILTYSYLCIIIGVIGLICEIIRLVLIAKHKCPKCDSAVHLSHNFCPNCGSEITDSGLPWWWLYITGVIEFWLEIIKLKIIVAFSQLGFLIIKPIVYSMSRKRTKKGLPMTDPRIVRISNFGKNLMIKEYKASNLLKRYGK